MTVAWASNFGQMQKLWRGRLGTRPYTGYSDLYAIDIDGATVPADPVAEAPEEIAVDQSEEDLEGEEIVVVGQKPRGSVVGDIPAENVLTARDVRATGATGASELLDAIAPQTGSARGRGGGLRFRAR